jgi:hypothetical protein
LLAVVTIVVAIGAALPAAAAGAQRTTYLAAECSFSPTGGTMRFTGAIDPVTGLPKIAHLRDAVNFNDVIVWNGTSWQVGGTDDVTISFNGEPLNGVTARGDFLLTLVGVGAWQGTWAWNQKHGATGHGVGKGVDSNSQLKITWWQTQPAEWGIAPFTGCPQPGQTFIFMRLDIAR